MKSSGYSSYLSAAPVALILSALLVTSAVAENPPGIKVPLPQAGLAIFETDAELDRWFQIGTATDFGREATRGNPGGFLRAHGRLGSHFDTGAKTLRPEHTGRFWHPGAISFDMRYATPAPDYEVQVFIEYNTTSEKWYRTLNVSGPGGKHWRHHVLRFNPAWTDQQAMKHGWQRTQTSRDVRSWRETMEDVHSIGVRATTTKTAKYGFNMDLDNFIVQK